MTLKNISMNSFLHYQVYCFLLCNVYIATFTSDTRYEKKIFKLLTLANKKEYLLNQELLQILQSLLYKKTNTVSNSKIFSYKDDMFNNRDHNQEKQNIGNNTNNKIFFNFHTGEFELREEYKEFDPYF